MSINKVSLLFFSFLFFTVQGKAQKKEKKNIEKIYSSAISKYYEGKSISIVVLDSTFNEYIVATNYSDLANDYDKRRGIFSGGVALDTSWKTFLRKADAIKHNLRHNEIPEIKLTASGVKLVSNDSIKISFKNTGWEGFRKTFGVNDLVKLSNVILYKKKAVVELSRSSGGLSGEGIIFFLQKLKRRWVIVLYLPTWVS